jgi:hypothetical protein
MGYHITIRREPGAPVITVEEFAAASTSFSELAFDASVGSAEFYKNGQLEGTLLHQEGEIWTKVYEPEVVSLMARLASSLKAKAYGDEDEWYSEDGQAHYAPGVLEARIIEIQKIKRRRLLVSIAKMTILAIVLTLMIMREMKK